MAKSIPITAKNLLSEFYKEYESKNNRFLLFDLANANENANTKVLKNLLLYNNHQFLPSFLERVGLPAISDFSKINVTDQKKAIGPEDTGFIDLYIEYDGLSVIIENKIYGAGDTDKQLARYIATVNGVENKKFNDWYNNPTVTKETHVVYLTADGSKEPTDHSLPQNIKDLITDTYYAINYIDNILPWLEEDVKPNLSFGDDGMMIAGVLQYIAFLKQSLRDESSQVVDSFVNNLQGTADNVKYKTLLNAIPQNKKEIPENVQKSLRKQLGAHAEAIFSGDVDGEWMLHFTPSFILLYKKSWAALDTRKYSIPSLYINVGNTNYFLKNGCFNKFTLGVDHLSPEAKSIYPRLTFTNHDKLVFFPLNNPSNIKCSDVDDPTARKDFYKQIIQQLQPIVDQIDQVVAGLLSSGDKITPNDILDSILSQKIF